MRYAHNGIWGKGLYFTESLSYSDCSSFNLPGSENKIRQIFLSKVLTGKIYESEPDGSIQMPPANPDTGLKYDSVKGRDGIHIIYENGRSYPEYLLSYTYDYALTQKTIEENERVGVFNNSYATLLKTGGVEGQRYQSKNTPKEGGTSNRYQPKGPRLFGGSGMGSNGLN